MDEINSSPTKPSTLDGWSEWRHYTLSELKRLNETIGRIDTHAAERDIWVSVEITKLKMQAVLWGSVAGIFTGIFTSLVASIIVKVVT